MNDKKGYRFTAVSLQNKTYIYEKHVLFKRRYKIHKVTKLFLFNKF